MRLNYLKSESNIVTLLCLISLFLVFTAIIIGEILQLYPCKLCLYARWPHYATALILLLYKISPSETTKRVSMAFGALAMTVSAFISIFHSGVELRIWDGPLVCNSPPRLQNLSVDELLDQILATPIIRCDEIVWDLFSLSMANWNALISLFILIFGDTVRCSVLHSSFSFFVTPANMLVRFGVWNIACLNYNTIGMKVLYTTNSLADGII